jgi:MFS family permease
LSRDLIFIVLSLFTWGVGEGMFINFTTIYMQELGSTPQQIGVILGAWGAAMAITHIPAGRLSDRFGRRPILILAWALGLVAAVIMALAQDLQWFVVGLLIYGLTAFVSSPLSSYVTAGRGKWTVAQTLSLISASYSFGMALGPILGGWIGDTHGLRAMFFVVVGIFTVSNVVIQFIGHQPLDQHDPAMPPVNLLSNRRLMSYLLVVALAVFAMYLPQSLTPNFLQGERGLSLSQMGVIFTAGALGNALLSILMGRFSPRAGYPISQVLVGLFALIMWRGGGMPVFALGYFLMGGFRAARPLAQAQVRELVHESQMGLAYGAMETVTSVVYILTPPLAGLLYARDPIIVYPIAIGLIAFSVVISLSYSPRKASHA